MAGCFKCQWNYSRCNIFGFFSLQKRNFRWNRKIFHLVLAFVFFHQHPPLAPPPSSSMPPSLSNYFNSLYGQRKLYEQQFGIKLSEIFTWSKSMPLQTDIVLKQATELYSIRTHTGMHIYISRKLIWEKSMGTISSECNLLSFDSVIVFFFFALFYFFIVFKLLCVNSMSTFDTLRQRIVNFVIIRRL